MLFYNIARNRSYFNYKICFMILINVSLYTSFDWQTKQVYGFYTFKTVCHLFNSNRVSRLLSSFVQIEYFTEKVLNLTQVFIHNIYKHYWRACTVITASRIVAACSYSTRNVWEKNRADFGKRVYNIIPFISFFQNILFNLPYVLVVQCICISTWI